jgi:micrococcal nuclease
VPTPPTRPLALVLAALPALLAAAALVLLAPPPDGGRPTGGAATVVRVVDGDTLVVDLGGREATVRLIGIDTPETVDRDAPVECYGAEASARLGELLPPGTAVRLVRDVEPRDVYDRLLAYVHRASDGLVVNVSLVADGFAAERHLPPNTALRPDIERAEQAARGAGLGLWGACGGPHVALPATAAGGVTGAGRQ